MKIFLTGASGYLGSLLIDSWLSDSRIEKIIALDVNRPRFLFGADHPKIHFIQKNLADVDLDLELQKFMPIDIVAHAAYFIRTPYFKKDQGYQKHSNFTGAANVFNFVFSNNISKLIHFSTVASYGALPANDTSKKFIESDSLNESQIAYGRDKKLVEEDLKSLFSKYSPTTQVFVLRIGSVAGPFLQNMVKKLGLQRFLKTWSFFTPVTNNKGARQYVHEDDAVGAVNFCAANSFAGERFLTFNVAADCFLTFKEMARLLRKKAVKIPHYVAKLVFSLAWNLSLGFLPTPPGTINSYSYPIIVDGSAITKYGFSYKYNCPEAFLGTKGKFAPKI